MQCDLPEKPAVHTSTGLASFRRRGCRTLTLVSVTRLVGMCLWIVCGGCQLTASEPIPDNGAPCGTLTGNACDRTESRRCRYFYGKGKPLCVDRAAAACDHCPGECVAPWSRSIFDDPGEIPGDPACQDAIDDALAARSGAVVD
jgi:hypothetical protein